MRIFAKKVTVSNYEDPHGNCFPTGLSLIASGLNGRSGVFAQPQAGGKQKFV